MIFTGGIMKSLGLTRFVFMLITLFLYFSIVARSANAATYYVSTNGSASWSNCTSSSNPCAVSTSLANAVAGDTVNFLAGTYYVADAGLYYQPNWNPAHSGTSGTPITFQANPGDTVTLIGTAPVDALIGSYNKNYITWKGFIIDTSGYGDVSGSAVVINGCTGVVLDSLTLIGHTYSSVGPHWSAIYSQGGSVNTTIRNCKIYGWHNPTEGAGIGLFTATGLLIEHNEIYSNDKGISLLQGDTGTIRNNLIHDIGKGIRGPGNASSIRMDIYQNIFYNISTNAVEIEAEWPSSAIYNNTFYNISGVGIATWSGVTSSTVIDIYNNLFQLPSTFLSKSSAAVFNSNYNDFYNGVLSPFAIGYTTYSFSSWKSVTGLDVNSITTDPLFVNASGHDFHLQANSPARTKGEGGGAMGAYIKGDEVIGLTSATSYADSTSTPSAPIGLVVQ
jgi:parallel beta-helix repeat protein